MDRSVHRGRSAADLDDETPAGTKIYDLRTIPFVRSRICKSRGRAPRLGSLLAASLVLW